MTPAELLMWSGLMAGDDPDEAPTVRTLIARPPWQGDALCREYPQHWFFPSQNGQVWRKGVQVCDQCAVRAECLAWALEHDEVGTWGGVVEWKRRRLRTRRAA